MKAWVGSAGGSLSRSPHPAPLNRPEPAPWNRPQVLASVLPFNEEGSSVLPAIPPSSKMDLPFRCTKLPLFLLSPLTGLRGKWRVLLYILADCSPYAPVSGVGLGGWGSK